MCGSCGSIHSGPRQWVPLDVSVVTRWPTLGLQSLRVDKPQRNERVPRARRIWSALWPLFFAPVSVEIVANPNPVDSDASFRAEVADAPSRVQPVPAAKLRRVRIVEALDSDVTGKASSSSSSSSDSVSDSDSGSDSPRSAGSGDSSTVTSSSETKTAPVAPPPKKKLCHTAVRVGNNAPQLPAAIDVDAEFGSAPQ